MIYVQRNWLFSNLNVISDLVPGTHSSSADSHVVLSGGGQPLLLSRWPTTCFEEGRMPTKNQSSLEDRYLLPAVLASSVLSGNLKYFSAVALSGGR